MLICQRGQVNHSSEKEIICNVVVYCNQKKQNIQNYQRQFKKRKF